MSDDQEHPPRPAAVRDHICNARAAVCFDMLRSTVSAVKDGNSADSFLAGCFHENKRFGSRDRRFIRDTVFAVFRCAAALGRAGIDLNSPEGILISRLTEGLELDPVDGLLCRQIGISADVCKMILDEQTCFQRFSGVLRLLKNDFIPQNEFCFLPEELIPELSVQDLRFPQWIMKRPACWLRANGEYDFSSKEYETLKKHGAVRVLNPDGALAKTEDLKNGHFEMQDLSSQCIGYAAAAMRGESWLDACAGAGGKSIQLAVMMQNNGAVFARDIYKNKLREVERRASKAGISIIQTEQLSALETDSLHLFDGVLVDAPCTSSGRWRRNPDARLMMTPDRITETAELQSRILEAASKAVRPGGVLIYATCSAFHRENRDQVRRFLQNHPEFHAEPFPHPFDKTKQTDGMLEIMPWEADSDAAFAARLRKSGPAVQKK